MSSFSCSPPSSTESGGREEAAGNCLKGNHTLPQDIRADQNGHASSGNLLSPTDATPAPEEEDSTAVEGFDTKPDLHAIQSQMQMREAKPYKCTQCIKSFANSSYLSQHMRIHLGIKPFGPCQYCGKKFTQLSHLQQHIRTHTGEKPYKCKYQNCDKAFSQLSNLQSHSRCHQSDKPFKCNSCYKCFTDEQSLLEHIPKHKESKHLKVHICPFCGKSYTQATYLSKHMTKHADRTRNTIRHDFGVGGSSSNGNQGGNDSSAPSLDLHQWNGSAQLPNMPDDAAQAQQLAFSQFNANMMASAAVSTQSAAVVASAYPPAAAALNNSAFSQLINFQRNQRYLDSYNFKPSTDRPAGFNMITPLENIQRYTQQGSAPVTTSASSNGNGHLQFPSNIISPMKPNY